MNLIPFPFFIFLATTISSSDWATVISAITDQVSVSTVVAVLAALVSACIGLVFMWWGVRKMAGAIMSAFKRGKLRI